jgi:hypothetical protein
MPAEENAAIIRRVIEETFDRGNPDVADEILVPEYMDRAPGHARGDTRPRGVQGVRRRISCGLPQPSRRDRSADSRGRHGRGAVDRHGNPHGRPRGSPADGQATLPGIEIGRFTGDKLVEAQEGYDSMNLLQQLGVILQTARVPT